MSEQQKTTRRTFIGLAAAGSAGVALAPGAAWSVGGAQPTPTAAGRVHYRIFSSERIGSMQLKNRIIRSAAFEGSGDADGFVTDDMIRLHRAYAEGGVGLTLAGYMAVMEYGRKGSHVCASDDRYIPGLARLAAAVHAADSSCRIGAEIGHDGGAQPVTAGGGPPGPASAR